MLPTSPTSLLSSLTVARNSAARVAVGSRPGVTWAELQWASTPFPRKCGGNVRGCSVVLATIDPFTAASALIQLDGVARRIVLCPPDLSPEHLSFVADTAEADVILTDQPELASIDPRVELILPGRQKTTAGGLDLHSPIQTEWVLLTSGTTGRPKLVVHTLASLAGAIKLADPVPAPVVWSTFYDIRRYGGLQIFLRAALTGASLVLPGAQESTADFLARAGSCGVTHISGTPSHWRSALMSPFAAAIVPAYVRLSGEIADQAILNQLQSQYPEAKIVHAFASTEAGLAFEVSDRQMGIPVDTIGATPNVEMKVEQGSLRVRSARTASRYLGDENRPLKDADGFVDTGDLLDLRDCRYYFVGRRDGTINVGGLKVHPEEVEAVINRHPAVGVSLVKTKKNPITGALVVADVVLRSPLSVDRTAHALQSEILRFCRGELANYKVPVAINFVPALAVAKTGKLMRPHA
jgi:acyl-coenzyme A synthetase/AMP-(fatty) acid ligase